MKRTWVYATMLLLFSLLYVQMDAGLFWREPLAYFRGGDFYYYFIISMELGLLGTFLPVSSILCTQAGWKKDAKSLFGQSWRSIMMAVLIPAFSILIYVVFLGIVCPIQNKNTGGWQSMAIRYTYGWRAEQGKFVFYILTIIQRVIISAFIQCLITLAFLFIFGNKYMGCSASFLIMYVFENGLRQLGLDTYTMTFLQVPPIQPDVILKDCLISQATYAFVAIGIWILAYYGRQLYNKKANQWKIRYQHTEALHLHMIYTYWIPAVVSILVVQVLYLKETNLSIRIIEMLGGISWATPQPDIQGGLRWIVLLALPILYHLNRENTLLTQKTYITSEIWSAFISFALTLVAIIITGWITDAKFTDGYGVYAMGRQISFVEIVGISGMLFILQGVMILQLHEIVDRIIKSKWKTALIILGFEFVLMIFTSNENELLNVFIPSNWGMALRTQLFSPNRIIDWGSEGECIEYYLASIPLHGAASGLFILNGALMFIRRGLSQKRNGGQTA